MKKKSYVIAVDFDGTCTAHDFPRVGNDIGAARVLKRLTDAGHRLILWTMRSDIDDVHHDLEDKTIHPHPGQYLTDAINWFEKNGIPLYGIQRNPTQHQWTTSPKCYAELYIDDAALGAPLAYNTEVSDRPFIDWEVVEIQLENRGILPKTISWQDAARALFNSHE
jgi:hypothetical protein